MRFIAASVLSALVLGACGTDSRTEPSTDAGATQPAEETSNAVDVSMTEYAFGMPAEVTGGAITFKFTNAGQLPHEAAFGSIEGDRDVNDVLKALEKGDPPAGRRTSPAYPYSVPAWMRP